MGTRFDRVYNCPELLRITSTCGKSNRDGYNSCFLRFWIYWARLGSCFSYSIYETHVQPMPSQLISILSCYHYDYTSCPCFYLVLIAWLANIGYITCECVCDQNLFEVWFRARWSQYCSPCSNYTLRPGQLKPKTIYSVWLSPVRTRMGRAGWKLCYSLHLYTGQPNMRQQEQSVTH